MRRDVMAELTAAGVACRSTLRRRSLGLRQQGFDGAAASADVHNWQSNKLREKALTGKEAAERMQRDRRIGAHSTAAIGRRRRRRRRDDGQRE